MKMDMSGIKPRKTEKTNRDEYRIQDGKYQPESLTRSKL